MESVYECSNCRHESPFYLADCPACGRGFFNLKGVAAHAQAVAYAGAGAPQGEPRVCYKCDHEAREAGDRCPRCGAQKLMTARAVRALGGVLVGLGLFLVVFMGAITVIVAGIIINTGDPNATTRFSGGTKEAVLIFSLFGLVIAFGAACTVGGAAQLARGRRSKTAARVVFGLFIALAVVAQIIFIFLD